MSVFPHILSKKQTNKKNKDHLALLQSASLFTNPGLYYKLYEPGTRLIRIQLSNSFPVKGRGALLHMHHGQLFQLTFKIVAISSLPVGKCLK